MASTPTGELLAASEPLVAYQSQPEAVLRDLRRTRRRVMASGIVVGLAGVWAIWPQSHEIQPIAISDLAHATNSVSPLDLKAFDAPMWTLAALPPPPPPPPVPPTALVEQLLAVSLADITAPTAMFYRPNEDRIVTLHVGDIIGGRRIKAIMADKVILVWMTGTKTEVAESLFTDPRNAPATSGGGP